jgi:two-component system phosphate regulon sensor histidine kinase PhoR
MIFRLHSRLIFWNLLLIAMIGGIFSYYRAHLLLAVAIAAGLTIAFGYVLRGLISAPLRDIAAASRKLAAGDLSQRLPISGDEEIAALGNSLNTMAKSLSEQLQALSEGKRRLESIVGAMTEGVMVLDGGGSISLTNRALHKLIEIDRDLVGRTPLEVFRIPAIDEAVHQVMQMGESQVIEFPAGNGRVLQANVAAVPNTPGTAEAIVIVFHDLTEIRRTERIRRDFVANVSHEFKTPLTSIRGYAETLLSGALSDPKNAGDFLRIIERNAKNLETLVTDLLMLARLEAELPVAMEPINLRFVIDEQLASRQSTITQRQLTVSNECPADEIRSDRTRLSAAVSNLIDNAIYYNRPKGEIRITGETTNGSFQLSIADTGQGIPAESLPRIFERFYRVDKARSRESGRTGLGLSIVKHAIESLGGSITVTSRLGLGSTFTIKLPRE